MCSPELACGGHELQPPCPLVCFVQSEDAACSVVRDQAVEETEQI